ncbi:MAG: lacA 1 [Fibrobacteres bacterium]|nr:lacA 1 [Fibrobacterota bacterium]
MRAMAKAIARGCSRVAVFPIWLCYLLQGLLGGKVTAFYGYSQLMSLFPGTSGDYLRYAFYGLTLPRLGTDACICFGATLSHPGIEIGEKAYIGPFCNLGLCSLGDHVLLGTGVHVMSGFAQHGIADLEIPIREQPGTMVRVSIGEDCWIGNKAVIGADVGRKCVVGAASLVNRELPEYSVAVGNPARVLRSRKEDGTDPLRDVPLHA